MKGKSERMEEAIGYLKKAISFSVVMECEDGVHMFAFCEPKDSERFYCSMVKAEKDAYNFMVLAARTEVLP